MDIPGFVSTVTGYATQAATNSYMRGQKPSVGKALAQGIGDMWRDISGASAAERTSLEEAQRVRDWEERLSNSALQRSVTDAKLAGLNPATVAGTAGASTPSGVAAQGVSAGSNGLVSGLFRVMASAIGAGLASKAFGAVNSSKTVGEAVKGAKDVINTFDRGFIRSKPYAFTSMGKAGSGRYVAETLNRAAASMGRYPMLDVSLDSLLG